jgi:hypothetical protein
MSGAASAPFAQSTRRPMNQRPTFPLALAILGLILTAAGPLLPGGVHLVANHPPGAGHVTELIVTADGDILVGTEAGTSAKAEIRFCIAATRSVAVSGAGFSALLGRPALRALLPMTLTAMVG